MKTKLLIEIKTPDEFTLLQDENEDYDFINGKEYAKEWHKAVVDWFLDAKNQDSLADKDFGGNDNDKFEIYYSEDGDLPEANINVKKDEH